MKIKLTSSLAGVVSENARYARLGEYFYENSRELKT